jgi:hypothetical protein
VADCEGSAVESGLSYAESLIATKIAFMVVSGVAVVVMASAATWALVRSCRAALAFLRARALPRLVRTWVVHRFGELPLLSASAPLEAGELVKLVGVVEGRAVGRASFSGVASVVFRQEVGEIHGGSVERGLQAGDFRLRLDDGSTVCVRAGEAVARRALRLDDGRPHVWRGDVSKRGWFCESRIEPGDRIEVIGRLCRVLDVNAQRASDRQAALGFAVVAGDEALFLCFVTRERSPADRPAPSRLLPADPARP